MSLSPVEDESQRKRHKAYVASNVVVVPDDSQMPDDSLVVESWRPSVEQSERSALDDLPESFSQGQMPEEMCFPTIRISPHELAADDDHGSDHSADVGSLNLRLEKEMWRAESEKPETPKVIPHFDKLLPSSRLMEGKRVRIDLDSDSDTDKNAGAYSGDILRHPIVQTYQKG